LVDGFGLCFVGWCVWGFGCGFWLLGEG